MGYASCFLNTDLPDAESLALRLQEIEKAFRRDNPTEEWLGFVARHVAASEQSRSLEEPVTPQHGAP
jgi:hypothetical protein